VAPVIHQNLDVDSYSRVVEVGSTHQTETLMWSHCQVTESGSTRPIRTLMRTAIGVAEGGSSSQTETLMRTLSGVTEGGTSHPPEPCCELLVVLKKVSAVIHQNLDADSFS
jgi:hypothetical protein